MKMSETNPKTTEKEMDKNPKKQRSQKMKNGIKIMWMTFMLCFAALPIFATEISKSKEGPVTSNGTNETEDQILVGDSCTFTGKAGDVIMFGRLVNMEGTVSFSSILLGETINIKENIENDLYAGGTNVNISGKIGDNAYLAGESLTISSESLINGTVIAAGKELTIYGEVFGDIYATVGFLTIDGTVHGNVFAGAAQITITERGNIKGDLIYNAEKKLNDKESGRIDGTVTFKEDGVFGCETKNCRRGPRPGTPPMPKRGFRLVIKLAGLFSLVISGLLILLFPAFGKVFKEQRTPTRFGQSILWGLIPLLIYPVAAAILMINIPLGISMLLIMVPLAGFTTILGLTLLGQFLFRAFKWKNTNRHLHFLFGCAVFTPVLMIPVLSNLVLFTLSALGWGVLLEILFNTKFGKGPKAPAQIEKKTSSED